MIPKKHNFVLHPWGLPKRASVAMEILPRFHFFLSLEKDKKIEFLIIEIGWLFWTFSYRHLGKKIREHMEEINRKMEHNELHKTGTSDQA